jgi:hypothetical protein
MHQIYMDYAATTPTDKRVIEGMLPYFGDIYGNPSSLHAFGQAPAHVAHPFVHLLPGEVDVGVIMKDQGDDSQSVLGHRAHGDQARQPAHGGFHGVGDEPLPADAPKVPLEVRELRVQERQLALNDAVGVRIHAAPVL